MIGYGREFYFSLFTSRWKKVTGRVVHATVEETIDQYDERRSRFQARADYDYDYLGITRRGNISLQVTFMTVEKKPRRGWMHMW